MMYVILFLLALFFIGLLILGYSLCAVAGDNDSQSARNPQAVDFQQPKG